MRMIRAISCLLMILAIVRRYPRSTFQDEEVSLSNSASTTGLQTVTIQMTTKKKAQAIKLRKSTGRRCKQPAKKALQQLNANVARIL